MFIHFLKPGELVTNCGETTIGRDAVPVTDKKRDVSCPQCQLTL